MPDDELEAMGGFQATQAERLQVLDSYRRLIAEGALNLSFADNADPPMSSIFETMYWNVTDGNLAVVTFRPKPTLFLSESAMIVDAFRTIAVQLARQSPGVVVSEYDRFLRGLSG